MTGAPRFPRSATQMPEFRAALMDRWRFTNERSWLQPELPSSYGHNSPYDVLGGGLSKDDGIQQNALRMAALLWVGGEAVDLLRSMAESIPRDISFDDSPLDEALGFVGIVCFEHPVVEEVAPIGVTHETRAIHWGPNTDVVTGGVRAGVYRCVRWPTHFNDGEPVPNRESLNAELEAEPSHTAEWRWREPLSTADDEHGGGMTFPILLSLAELVKQTRLVTERSEQAPRSTRRRLERSGIDPGATRVIYLRGDTGGSRSEPSGESPYHHRWMVSGHWRSQPYGPGREMRRATYIAPHIKGPEGAPLLTGEKVRAITRNPNGVES